MQPPCKLSLVIPLYNEAANIPALCQEIRACLKDLDYEVLLVDDGSSDTSFDLLCQEAENDLRFKVIGLRRNFGQSAALAAGFDMATGTVIVTMDGDLQNDPADIPRLLSKLDEGYDVVSGWRKDRKDLLVSRRIPSLLANRLISTMTGVQLHDYGCTLKVYRREVLGELNLYGELHRFIPALASQSGARLTELPVNHRPRTAGVSKYGIDRTTRVLLDLVTVKFLLKYATRPMQLFGKWGLYCWAFAAVSGLATLSMKWFDGLSMNRNPLLILTAFLLFSGVHFLALGLLAELITRTYHETQGKAVYSVRKKVNL